jgi:hypothetical protein
MAGVRPRTPEAAGTRSAARRIGEAGTPDRRRETGMAAVAETATTVRAGMGAAEGTETATEMAMGTEAATVAVAGTAAAMGTEAGTAKAGGTERA